MHRVLEGLAVVLFLVVTVFEVDADWSKRFVHFALVVKLRILELEHFLYVLLYHLGFGAMMIIHLDVWTLLPSQLVRNGHLRPDNRVPTSHRIRLSRRLPSQIFNHFRFDDLFYFHRSLVFLQVPLLILNNIFRA